MARTKVPISKGSKATKTAAKGLKGGRGVKARKTVSKTTSRGPPPEGLAKPHKKRRHKSGMRAKQEMRRLQKRDACKHVCTSVSMRRAFTVALREAWGGDRVTRVTRASLDTLHEAVESIIHAVLVDASKRTAEKNRKTLDGAVVESAFRVLQDGGCGVNMVWSKYIHMK